VARVIAVEIEKCMGCRSCELACAVAHSASKQLATAIRERPRPQHRVTVMPVRDLAVPLQCRHCEDPPCVAVCPTGALQKTETEGAVLIDADKCIGCKACILVCPFGVIALSEDGHAIIKCDLCVERLEQGEEPACVAACPTRALSLKTVEEVAAAHRERSLGDIVRGIDALAGHIEATSSE